MNSVMTVITRHEPFTDTSETHVLRLRVIQSTAASSVITFHIHTYCILLTMDTCTNHIYTTLYAGADLDR